MSEPAIRLQQLTKRFGEKVAVDGVSLEIARGAIYGLIGPNGAGKTTTFSMMAGFLKPTKGTVEVFGHAANDVRALRGRVGVLPQDAALPRDEKVGEFLVHLARLQGADPEAAERASRGALEEVEGKDWWSLRCRALSHGMAKRVQLAQALLGDPDLLLFDEPTAGLDPKHAHEVRELIKSRRERATMIISSHNLHELEALCDGAAILDHGRVVASGTIGELTAQSEEIHIQLAETPRSAANYKGPLSNILPLAELRAIPHVPRVEFHDETRELTVYLERAAVEPEWVVNQTLWLLLQREIRIRGLTMGRGLEKRVMDLG